MRMLLLASLTIAGVPHLVCSASPHASQDAAQKTPPPSAAESYPNTADGWDSLLADLLAAAKSDDQAKLRSKLSEMDIPDYGNWFAHTYGQEKGQALADTYGKSLKLTAQHFEMLWVELAKEEGQISINKLDAANRKFDLAKKDDTLANPTDEFEADWKKTDSTVGPARQAIGYFCFVDGRFRLRSFPSRCRYFRPPNPDRSCPQNS
jgi:hypothetical protein